jgi:hypothetical protein
MSLRTAKIISLLVTVAGAIGLLQGATFMAGQSTRLRARSADCFFAQGSRG